MIHPSKKTKKAKAKDSIKIEKTQGSKQKQLIMNHQKRSKR